MAYTYYGLYLLYYGLYLLWPLYYSVKADLYVVDRLQILTKFAVLALMYSAALPVLYLIAPHTRTPTPNLNPNPTPTPTPNPNPNPNPKPQTAPSP